MWTVRRCLAASLVAALGGAAVLLAAGPDYFAAFDHGNLTPGALDAEGGKKRTVYAYFGNQGSSGQRDVQIWINAYLIGGGTETQVCRKDLTTKLAAQTASRVIAFSLFYPATDPKAKVAVPAKAREYMLTATVAEPNTGQGSEEDQETVGNNMDKVTIKAPAGGIPSCSLVVNVPIPPNVLKRK